uniref:DUF5671 domain-containing protein n=1 Tax=candidate division WWE3 bacterium TaxID=2053526 RepID=A0A7C4TLR7_UNCKA
MKFNLRLLYLYLFSFVGLIITVIGSVQLVDLGLKTFIFKNADSYVSYPMAKPVETDKMEIQPSQEEIMKYQRQETRNQREREMSNSLAMIMVGLPLYLYHWKTIQKEQNPES